LKREGGKRKESTNGGIPTGLQVKKSPLRLGSCHNHPWKKEKPSWRRKKDKMTGGYLTKKRTGLWGNGKKRDGSLKTNDRFQNMVCPVVKGEGEVAKIKRVKQGGKKRSEKRRVTRCQSLKRK